MTALYWPCLTAISNVESPARETGSVASSLCSFLTMTLNRIPAWRACCACGRACGGAGERKGVI